MEILGALPNLMILHLGWESYVGKRLVLKAEAFPNLRTLNMWGLNQPRQVVFEEGPSPQMERIQISGCLLRLGIIGTKNLPRLKEISLGDCAQVAKLAMLQGEVDSHPNYPVLRLAGGRTQHDPRGCR